MPLCVLFRCGVWFYQLLGWLVVMCGCVWVRAYAMLWLLLCLLQCLWARRMLSQLYGLPPLLTGIISSSSGACGWVVPRSVGSMGFPQRWHVV